MVGRVTPYAPCSRVDGARRALPCKFRLRSLRSFAAKNNCKKEKPICDVTDEGGSKRIAADNKKQNQTYENSDQTRPRRRNADHRRIRQS